MTRGRPPLAWRSWHGAAVLFIALACGDTACGDTPSASALTDAPVLAGPLRAAPDSARADSATGSLGRRLGAIELAAPVARILRGDTLRLAVVARNENDDSTAAEGLAWSSSAPEVATVDSTGLVNAVAPGAAVIEVAGEGAQASVMLVVEQPYELAEAPADPELPKVAVDMQGIPSRARRQVRVANGGNLQAAIDGAQAGDEILLAAGATFTGNFVLPKRSSPDGWVTIRTDTDLPAAGQRMTPDAAEKGKLAKLLTRLPAPVVATAAGATGWRLLGVEISAVPTLKQMNGLVYLGDGSGAQSTADKVPSRLVLDRVYVHGHGELNFQRCVTLNAAHVAVLNSTIDECHGKGFDSQALVGWNGPGPFLIENNYLAGAGEIIMFGGSDSAIENLVPSDIVIRGNHVTRPVEWKGTWTVKNVFELKSGRRVLVEGNAFENHWADAQSGAAILWKSVNQGGRAPWSQTSDVTFRFNVVRNTPGGFNLSATAGDYPAVPMTRVRITQNYLVDFGTFAGTESGRAFQFLGGVADIQIDHNTIVHNAPVGLAMVFEGAPLTRAAFRDNIMTLGQYGVKGNGKAAGSATIDAYMPGGAFTGNVVVGASASTYPRGNRFPQSLGDVGFAGPTELVLRGASAFRGAASDGSDPGADPSVLTIVARARAGGAGASEGRGTGRP